MPHEDFFERVLIEFVEWDKGHEHDISKFNSFDDLPLNLMSYLKHKPYPLITLKGHKWEIIRIRKDLRAHGKGIHIKVELEKIHYVTFP